MAYALRCYWQALLVAYLSTGSVDLSKQVPEDQSPSSWEEITKKAITSNDEHVIKIIYTCWQESLHYDNKDYQNAAQMVINNSF